VLVEKFCKTGSVNFFMAQSKLALFLESVVYHKRYYIQTDIPCKLSCFFLRKFYKFLQRLFATFFIFILRSTIVLSSNITIRVILIAKKVFAK
jgi:hypothetical protein